MPEERGQPEPSSHQAGRGAAQAVGGGSNRNVQRAGNSVHQVAFLK